MDVSREACKLHWRCWLLTLELWRGGGRGKIITWRRDRWSRYCDGAFSGWIFQGFSFFIVICDEDGHLYPELVSKHHMTRTERTTNLDLIPPLPAFLPLSIHS